MKSILPAVLKRLRADLKHLSKIRANGREVTVALVKKDPKLMAELFPKARFSVQLGGLTVIRIDVDVGMGRSGGAAITQLLLQRYYPNWQTGQCLPVYRPFVQAVTSADFVEQADKVSQVMSKHIRLVSGLPEQGFKFPLRWAITLVSKDIQAAKDALHELIRDFDGYHQAINCNGSERFSLASRFCSRKA